LFVYLYLIDAAGFREEEPAAALLKNMSK